jgi:tetratricopeptide repeat protein 30
MKQYAGALKYITEIIERGIKDHPGIRYQLHELIREYLAELSVGLQTEGLDVRSVGNTQVHNDYTGPQSFIHSIHSILMTVMIQWIYIML